MRYAVPDKFSPRRTSVKVKVLVFSPSPNEWRVVRNGKLVTRKFITREEAREYSR